MSAAGYSARPRPAAIDKAKLRAALEQRTKEWRAALRAEPEVARIMLRRLIGPITLWKEEAVPGLSMGSRTVTPGSAPLQSTAVITAAGVAAGTPLYDTVYPGDDGDHFFSRPPSNVS